VRAVVVDLDGEVAARPGQLAGGAVAAG